MTPKEKAKELVDLFTFTCREWDFEDNSKKCALIAVDEIEKEIFTYYERFEYWKEVKQEIEKL